MITIQGGAGKRNWRRKQRHDFGVQIIHAPEPFNLTKVIIVSNRIVLRNSSSIELEVRQRGADVGFNHRLPLDSVLPYHWDDARKPMELQMRPLDDAVGTWKWSGRIRLDKEGRYGMRIMSSEEGETYRSRTPQQLILIVDVSLMGLNLVDVNAVPLRLAEIHYADLFEMTSDLQRRLLTTVKSTILFEFYKILGTVDILGTPVALISSVGTGVVDFFANPARGIMSSPEDFARGMASGTVSLLRNSMYGVFNTAAKVTGSMSKGLAALSMDDDFIMHLKAPNRTSADASVFRGVQDLGFGLIQGVTGLVYDPIRGAEREGLKGFVKGLISGIAGVAMKPAAGVFEFAAKTACVPLQRKRLAQVQPPT